MALRRFNKLDVILINILNNILEKSKWIFPVHIFGKYFAPFRKKINKTIHEWNQ